jgi:hypothetical protein
MGQSLPYIDISDHAGASWLLIFGCGFIEYERVATLFRLLTIIEKFAHHFLHPNG